MSVSGCCDSECIMMGKCIGEECEIEEDVCIDQNCFLWFVVYVLEEVCDGVVVFILINYVFGLFLLQYSFDF